MYRNSVGFDWAPFNGNMYFTDNGRDEISELYPDDELNVINSNQANYGFPNCHTLGSGPTIDRDVGCTKSFRDPLVVANCNSATLNKNAILALGPRVVPLGNQYIYPSTLIYVSILIHIYMTIYYVYI